MASTTITPLSEAERAVIRNAVDQAPPLSPSVAVQLVALLRGVK